MECSSEWPQILISVCRIHTPRISMLMFLSYRRQLGRKQLTFFTSCTVPGREKVRCLERDVRTGLHPSNPISPDGRLTYRNLCCGESQPLLWQRASIAAIAWWRRAEAAQMSVHLATFQHFRTTSFSYCPLQVHRAKNRFKGIRFKATGSHFFFFFFKNISAACPVHRKSTPLK